MTVKQQLIAEIESIDNPTTLSQLFEVLQLVNQNIQTQTKRKNPVMQFAGCLDNDDAQAMRTTINNEFNKIEGEW
jgi:anionic cell wall polymer biosynthesis LytR-Cps2A-Psr (LCP) family protein